MAVDVVDTGVVGSFLAVWLRSDRRQQIREGGEGIKIGMVVVDSDVSYPAVPVPRDLSSAVSLAMVLTSPEGVEETRVATAADFGGAAGDASDGAIMVEDDGLLTAGTWSFRAEVDLGGGVSFVSDSALLLVAAAT